MYMDEGYVCRINQCLDTVNVKVNNVVNLSVTHLENLKLLLQNSFDTVFTSLGHVRVVLKCQLHASSSRVKY